MSVTVGINLWIRIKLVIGINFLLCELFILETRLLQHTGIMKSYSIKNGQWFSVYLTMLFDRLVT